MAASVFIYILQSPHLRIRSSPYSLPRGKMIMGNYVEHIGTFYGELCVAIFYRIFMSDATPFAGGIM